MLKRISKTVLRIFGWSVHVDVPDYPKAVICVAPHTSNWDFLLGELAITSVGRKAGFLMKRTWFFWPLGPFFRSIGGIPVDQKKSTSLTNQLIDRFNSAQKLTIAITPEGTRSRTTRWRTGFLRVSCEANVPLCLASIDFPTKTITLAHTFRPSGDIDSDLRRIKDFYKPFTGKYPDKFTTDDDHIE